MKFYLRLFIVSVLGFALIFTGVWYFFFDSAKVDAEVTALPQDLPEFTLPNEDGIIEVDPTNKVTDESKVEKSELDKLVELSDRVNFVVFAHDGSRADTIMFVSFDPTNQYLDIINIPRDTYWLVEGYTERADHKKINAVYGHAGDKGGSQGLKQEISNMLQVPVNYYVKFNYEGASEVVDVLGGLEINVPFDMKYDDVWADPELHIDLKAGLQTLDGKNAVDYLRWRQNNDTVKSTGDLPRIQRMQEFIEVALKKSMSLKLPSVVSTGIKYVQTDIAANLAIALADDAIGMPASDITTVTLPGDAPPTSTYFISDPEAIEQLLIDMYRKGK
ncbi:MAG: LCP family protein [Clostridia bacterium]|nr:LCP family protein [Clostridia bacterium]